MAQIMVQCNGNLESGEFVEVKLGDDVYQLGAHEAVDLPVVKGVSLSARVVGTVRVEESALESPKVTAVKPA